MCVGSAGFCARRVFCSIAVLLDLLALHSTYCMHGRVLLDPARSVCLSYPSLLTATPPTRHVPLDAYSPRLVYLFFFVRLALRWASQQDLDPDTFLGAPPHVMEDVLRFIRVGCGLGLVIMLCAYFTRFDSCKMNGWAMRPTKRIAAAIMSIGNLKFGVSSREPTSCFWCFTALQPTTSSTRFCAHSCHLGEVWVDRRLPRLDRLRRTVARTLAQRPLDRITGHSGLLERRSPEGSSPRRLPFFFWSYVCTYVALSFFFATAVFRALRTLS